MNLGNHVVALTDENGDEHRIGFGLPVTTKKGQRWALAGMPRDFAADLAGQVGGFLALRSDGAGLKDPRVEPFSTEYQAIEQPERLEIVPGFCLYVFKLGRHRPEKADTHKPRRFRRRRKGARR